MFQEDCLGLFGCWPPGRLDEAKDTLIVLDPPALRGSAENGGTREKYGLLCLDGVNFPVDSKVALLVAPDEVGIEPRVLRIGTGEKENESNKVMGSLVDVDSLGLEVTTAVKEEELEL